MAKDMKRQLIKEDVQMTNKPMKRCSTSLAYSKMQIKTTMNNYYTLIRMTKINSKNTNCR